MNHFNATARSPLKVKRHQLFFILVMVSLIVTVYWHWSSIISQLIDWQKIFHTKLASHISAAAKDTTTYGWTLTGLSFAYGIFHAVGPGHGKAVIATYLGTHRESISKGIGISMSTALLQSLVAITLVTVLSNILRFKFAEIDNYGEDMALVSYVLIMILGLVLSISATRRLFHLRRLTKQRQPVAHNHVNHHRGSSHQYEPSHNHNNSLHIKGSCSCQHAHVASAGQSWTHTLAVIFSSGIRPCSGAIVVLIYAHLVGAFHYGVIATLFMGLGTGLSVSVIALGAQYARHWLEQKMTKKGNEEQGSFNHAIISISVRLTGGAILMLLGWGLYQATLKTALEHPLL